MFAICILVACRHQGYISKISVCSQNSEYVWSAFLELFFRIFFPTPISQVQLQSSQKTPAHQDLPPDSTTPTANPVTSPQRPSGPGLASDSKEPRIKAQEAISSASLTIKQVLYQTVLYGTTRFLQLKTHSFRSEVNQATDK